MQENPAKSESLKNSPELWRGNLPQPKPADNKYSRGHLLVLGGALHQTGASRLAAMAGLRVGAGAVTIASLRQSLLIYAAHLTAIMVSPVSGARDFVKLLAEKHISGIVIGPASGVTEKTYEFAIAALESELPLVMDADALSVFSSKHQNRMEELFALIKKRKAKTVLTPHEGEFKRLFGELPGTREERARAAAIKSGAVILLKGNETVIAAFEGKTIINKNAPATLATAGSGDVLAGIIGGLAAQGMDVFEASCAGAWIHAEAANIFGPGLIAEDLPGLVPGVIGELESGRVGELKK